MTPSRMDLFVFAILCTVQCTAYQYFYHGTPPMPRNLPLQTNAPYQIVYSGASPVLSIPPSSMNTAQKTYATTGQSPAPAPVRGPPMAPSARVAPMPATAVRSPMPHPPSIRPPMFPMGGRTPYGGMGSLYNMGRRQRNFKKSPLYRGATSLGCSYGIDPESIVRFLYPEGCTYTNDFCPYKYSGFKRCTMVGSFGMCCPFYVTQNDIAASVQAMDFMKTMEMLS